MIDHKEQAYDLILGQYKDSPKLVGYIDSFLDISQNIEDQLFALFDKFNLDTALGDDLDTIGILMGLPRFPVEFTPQFFQLDVTAWDENLPFGDIPGLKFEFLDDERYRCVLKSWRVVLNSVGSINDIIKSIAALFCIEYSDVVVTQTEPTVIPFQLDVTPLDGPAAFVGGIPAINIDVNKALDIGDLYLYNYLAPNSSRIWAKIAGVPYTLTHL
jgi:hypothetical protein